MGVHTGAENPGSLFLGSSSIDTLFAPSFLPFVQTGQMSIRACQDNIYMIIHSHHRAIESSVSFDSSRGIEIWSIPELIDKPGSVFNSQAFRCHTIAPGVSGQGKHGRKIRQLNPKQLHMDTGSLAPPGCVAH
jgi:hypothetical protein